MNKDQKLIAEAYGQVNEMSATMLYIGDPADIHYFDDLEGRLEKIRQAGKRGIKFKTAYVKVSDGEYYFSEEPKEGFSPAFIPEHV